MPSGNSNAAPKTPYCAFLSDAADIAAVKALMEGKGLSSSGVLQGDAASAVEFLKSNPVPAVLIIEIPSAEAAPELLNKLADFCEPTTKVIAVGTVNEYSFYCWLMELGISSYLLKPLTSQALEAAWAKATEAPAAATAEKPKSQARFIGFMGTRGGAGSTTLSILFAGLLAQVPVPKGGTAKKIALVDLDPQDGSASLLLDLDPSRGLREALERPERIDALFLDRVMQKTSAGFSVLSAEESLHEQISYHGQAPEMLIAELQRKFDIVVLDLPRHVTPFIRGFLAVCDPLFAVTDLTLLGLRDALRLSDLARDHLRIKPPHFIANRVGLAPKFQMTSADFKKGLKADIAFHVPFAPDFFASVSAEMEMLKNKKSPGYKVLEQMVASVVSLPHAKEAPKHGWLKKGP